MIIFSTVRFYQWFKELALIDIALGFHKSGWPADLEFLETWKSQGILWHLQNVREKSGNFNTKLGKVREFYLHEMNNCKFINQGGQRTWNFWKPGKIREFYLCEMNIAKVFSRFIQVVNKI